jgi:hypothetical protein
MSPLSPKEMSEAVVRNMSSKTGKSLSEWVAIVNSQGFTGTDSAINWLKVTHKLGSIYAYQIAHIAFAGELSEYADEAKLMEELYEGERAKLRPIFDILWEIVRKINPDTQLVVCKTYSSFRLARQFAAIRPSTKDIVDLGLAMPAGTPYDERLVESKNLGGGDRIKHKIRLKSVSDIDGFVLKHLKTAAELHGK